MRIGGEAPRRRAHSQTAARRPWCKVGLPPPRSVICSLSSNMESELQKSQGSCPRRVAHVAGRRRRPAGASPVDNCSRQSVMRNFRASATIMVLRVPPRASAVRLPDTNRPTDCPSDATDDPRRVRSSRGARGRCPLWQALARVVSFRRLGPRLDQPYRATLCDPEACAEKTYCTSKSAVSKSGKSMIGEQPRSTPPDSLNGQLKSPFGVYGPPSMFPIPGAALHEDPRHHP